MIRWNPEDLACKNGASVKRKLLNAGTAKHDCDFVRNDEKLSRT